jgi:hypothetical protein
LTLAVLQAALLRAVAGAAGLLVLLAWLAVARRMTRPVERLIAVTPGDRRRDRA